MNRREREENQARIRETLTTAYRSETGGRKMPIAAVDRLVGEIEKRGATTSEIRSVAKRIADIERAQLRSFGKSVADTLAAAPTPVDFDADFRREDPIEGLRVALIDWSGQNGGRSIFDSTNATEASAGVQPVNRWQENLSMLDLAKPGVLDKALVPVSTPAERVSYAKELVSRRSAGLAARDLAPALVRPERAIEGRTPGDK